MTDLVKNVADDWDWDFEDIEENETKIASLFGRCNGIFINIPYNGHDGDLTEKLKTYRLNDKEKSDLYDIFEKGKEDDRKSTFPGDVPELIDFTFDEYIEIVEDDLHGMGEELSAMFSEIYGKIPRKNKKFLDFPSMDACDEIVGKEDPVRWSLYIG